MGTFVPEGCHWSGLPSVFLSTPVSQRGCPALTFGLGAPQGKTMDFVDVSESNARWVQDFRLKAYASPAKLESIDGEGPDLGGSGVWGSRGLVAPQRSLTLALELPGLAARRGDCLWPPPPVSWAQSPQLPLQGEVAGTWRWEAGMAHGRGEP